MEFLIYFLWLPFRILAIIFYLVVLFIFGVAIVTVYALIDKK